MVAVSARPAAPDRFVAYGCVNCLRQGCLRLGMAAVLAVVEVVGTLWRLVLRSLVAVFHPVVLLLVMLHWVCLLGGVLPSVVAGVGLAGVFSGSSRPVPPSHGFSLCLLFLLSVSLRLLRRLLVIVRVCFSVLAVLGTGLTCCRCRFF